MKKILLASALVIAFTLSSCIDKKNYYEEPPTTGANTSEYSTEQAVTLDIDYSRAGAKVLFYVYDKNPLVFTDYSMSLKEDVAPLDAAWTDDNGKFNGTMTLPAYVKEVYVVTGAFYATALMQGNVTNGTVTLSDAGEAEDTRASYGYSTEVDKTRFSSLGWSTALGTYDTGGAKPGTGKINYHYNGNSGKLKLTTAERQSLITTVNSVLKRQSSCPKEFRTEADLYVNDDNTEVVLTAISGNTCWNSSLGYYFYKEEQTPASLKDITVYTLFPNTQMYWQQNGAYSYPQGVKAGDDVQLLYFDNEHPNGTTQFPAGYRIGFVLACNAWDAYFTGYASYTETLGFFASSTKGLSTKRKDGLDVHTAMFKDKNNNIAIAFEDFRDDQNYTDLVFCVKSNPVITNVPEVDESNNTTITKTGIYAFEDMWPNSKDYDMNDVMAQYTYQKTFNNQNRILNESFTFKTFANFAVLDNGLAFTIDNTTPAATSDFIKFETEDFVSTKFVHEENAVLLTDNVKTAMNAEYKVVLDYGDESAKTKETITDAFVYRPSGKDTRIEIHCPMKRPTSKMNVSLFGTGDDRSVPENGIYYVSDVENVYPFAFYLSNATSTDVAPLLDATNEGTSIDLLYPKFLNWAKTGKDADWYKK